MCAAAYSGTAEMNHPDRRRDSGVPVSIYAEMAVTDMSRRALTRRLKGGSPPLAASQSADPLTAEAPFTCPGCGAQSGSPLWGPGRGRAAPLRRWAPCLPAMFAEAVDDCGQVTVYEGGSSTA